MKIVLDTNALLVSIAKRSPFHVVFRGIFEGKFQLCVSNEILTEYSEIIERKTNADIANNILDAILNSPFVEKSKFFIILTLFKLTLMITNLLIALFQQV